MNVIIYTLSQLKIADESEYSLSKRALKELPNDDDGLSILNTAKKAKYSKRIFNPENKTTGEESKIQEGAKVMVWFEDKKRYYRGIVVEVAENHDYLIEWGNHRKEWVNLRPEDCTHEITNTNRWAVNC